MYETSLITAWGAKQPQNFIQEPLRNITYLRNRLVLSIQYACANRTCTKDVSKAINEAKKELNSLAVRVPRQMQDLIDEVSKVKAKILAAPAEEFITVGKYFPESEHTDTIDAWVAFYAPSGKFDLLTGLTALIEVTRFGLNFNYGTDSSENN